ncbi:MAG: hydroxymethylbilane synthase [Bacteroidota bacterium]
MKKNKLVIGSRGSELALWQAKFVKTLLEKKYKNLSVELKIINTKGDKILDIALSKIGDKGLFTKELETELLNGSIDIAVHSLKDLQTELPNGLTLAAVTKRHPVQDVLVAKKKGITINNLPNGSIIATGSLRRRSQLLHLRPDLKIEELRGNVPTRIKKLIDSNWDAIILARAGVERLKLNKYISSVISIKQILPAVGQGALGIETRTDNLFALKVLKKINHEKTFLAVRAERALLKALEGGCQVPIGAYASVISGSISLEALVGSIDGTVTFRKKIIGNVKSPEKLGQKLASQLLKAGASEILDYIYRKDRSK